MIIWSPFIMDELAGLRDSAPPTINSDPTSPELASKTGFITNFSGPNNKKGAAWADVSSTFLIIWSTKISYETGFRSKFR